MDRLLVDHLLLIPSGRSSAVGLSWHVGHLRYPLGPLFPLEALLDWHGSVFSLEDNKTPA